jgi:2-polyprenyl-3-methyl-5-hydroxy-6-metoxy-1,4-benzoquinol methylase
MEYTGERPTLDHEILPSRMRYKSIIPYCLDKRVLDYGCGVGQGTYFLSKFTRSIIGIDTCREAVEDALKAFPSIKFATSATLADLENTDVVSMVEVIEHIEKESVGRLLDSLSHQVSTLVATTPNGDLFQYHPMTYAERRGFHVWHYTEDELKALFHRYYSFVEILGDLRDPALSGVHTSYTVYASNFNWKPGWVSNLYMTS